ncbi:MAG: MFS transporter [Alphaproteobacteria bacterium]|nr:MAG: MFS transporter [Alphaproteobacteria bacterium]
MLMAFAVPLSFAVWRTLLDNFAIQEVGFTGREIGILQSLREVPGFLTFLFVFITIFIREQRFGILSLGLLGLGTALTGFFPSAIGLYATTVLMSVGFHYYETANQSLTLQWVHKSEAPQTIGKIMAIGSFASLAAYGLIYLSRYALQLDYRWIYLIGGGITTAIAAYVYFTFPMYEDKVAQRKELVLRKRYWLYYALTFMSGARRQIFVVFAGFMMVERFHFPVLAMTTLYLTNHVLNMYLAPKIGMFIHKWGERRSLLVEYIGLIVIFSAYGLIAMMPVSMAHTMFGLPLIGFAAASLFFLDHAFFAMAMAIKTYFQKIADPADIAPTAGVAFSINHIAAVCLPVVLGLVWIHSNAAVFWIGAAMAVISLSLSRLVPRHPEPGRELVWGSAVKLPAPAE